MKWNNLLRKKQKGKEKVSIFWKIFAIFVAFIAVILSLLWVFQIGMLNTFYRSIKIHDIENSLKDISDNIDSDKLSTVLKNVANDKQSVSHFVPKMVLLSMPLMFYQIVSFMSYPLIAYCKGL